MSFTTENISSITIHVETKMVKHWEAILSEKFGDPIDRSKGESGKNNGKQWIDKAFKTDKEEKVSQMFVTLWHKPKKEQSTMLIQAENSCQFLNVSYVTNVQEEMITNAVSQSLTKSHSVRRRKDSVLTGFMIFFDNDHPLVF